MHTYILINMYESHLMYGRDGWKMGKLVLIMMIIGKLVRLMTVPIEMFTNQLDSSD